MSFNETTWHTHLAFTSANGEGNKGKQAEGLNQVHEEVRY